MFADLAGVTVTERGDRAEVEAHGELDLAALEWLRMALKVACSDTSGDVVVDVERVSSCDSRAIGLLTVASARLEKAGRRLIVQGNPPRQPRVFRRHGFDHLLAPA